MKIICCVESNAEYFDRFVRDLHRRGVLKRVEMAYDRSRMTGWTCRVTVEEKVKGTRFTVWSDTRSTKTLAKRHALTLLMSYVGGLVDSPLFLSAEGVVV